MPEQTTINDILTELDQIVDTTKQENSPLGIFAFVYRRTTAKIAEGIREERFEDPARMERFDVDFARRYIDAFWRFREGKEIPLSWEVAFNAAESDSEGGNLIIMQHLLLGMNAHINLDLGIAASEVAPGERIDYLKNDFMEVNRLLEDLIDEMQHRIGRASPLMFLLDWIGKRDDEAVVNFSIRKARDFAWNLARNLAVASEDEKTNLILQVDDQISGLGNVVAYPPGFLLPKVLSVIRFFEEKDTRKVIEKLKA